MASDFPDAPRAGADAGSLPRLTLVTLELIIAANAIYGGIGLMTTGLSMPTGWLAGTPWHTWTVPGGLLLAVIAAPMALAAWLELRRSARAHRASLAAGVLQIGWIAAQLVVLRRYFFLQPVLAGAGAAVLALAWWSHRADVRNVIRGSGDGILGATAITPAGGGQDGGRPGSKVPAGRARGE